MSIKDSLLKMIRLTDAVKHMNSDIKSIDETLACKYR